MNIYIWPDGTWCNHEDLSSLSFKGHIFKVFSIPDFFTYADIDNIVTPNGDINNVLFNSIVYEHLGIYIESFQDSKHIQITLPFIYNDESVYIYWNDKEKILYDCNNFFSFLTLKFPHIKSNLLDLTIKVAEELGLEVRDNLGICSSGNDLNEAYSKFCILGGWFYIEIENLSKNY